jgi:hypothetical protein
MGDRFIVVEPRRKRRLAMIGLVTLFVNHPTKATILTPLLVDNHSSRRRWVIRGGGSSSSPSSSSFGKKKRRKRTSKRAAPGGNEDSDTDATIEVLSSPFLDSFQEEVHSIVASYRSEVRRTFRKLRTEMKKLIEASTENAHTQSTSMIDGSTGGPQQELSDGDNDAPARLDIHQDQRQNLDNGDDDSDGEYQRDLEEDERQLNQDDDEDDLHHTKLSAFGHETSDDDLGIEDMDDEDSTSDDKEEDSSENDPEQTTRHLVPDVSSTSSLESPTTFGGGFGSIIQSKLNLGPQAFALFSFAILYLVTNFVIKLVQRLLSK